MILDRASGPMRKMQLQAIATDAAITKLGHSLDQVGSVKHQKNIGALTRSTTTLRNELGATERQSVSTGRAMRGLDNDTGRLHGAFRRTANALRDLTVLMMPAKFLLLGSAVGVLVQGVGALVGGLTALLPKIGDLAGLAGPASVGIFGIGLAAVTAKLAMSGLSQAMSGNKKALKELTPEARSFLATLKSYQPVMKQIRAQAQAGLFPGLTVALRQLARGAPTAQGIVRNMGARVGGVASRAASSLTTPQALSDFTQLGQAGGRTVSNMGDALISMIHVLRNFMVAAIPFTDWLSRTIKLWAAHRAAISDFNRDSGKTAAWFERTRRSLTLFVDIAKNVWRWLRNIMRAARPAGEEMWRAIDRATRRWADLTGSDAGQAKLTRQFAIMARSTREITGLVGDLARAIFNMGADPKLGKTITQLRELVPTLQTILTSLANTFGPAIVGVIKTFGDTLNTYVGLSSPLVLFLNIVTKLVGGVNSLARAFPPLRAAIGAALSVYLIQRFLISLGLLQRGWLGVAGAASIAAKSEAAALAGGAGRFGGGSMIPFGMGPGKATMSRVLGRGLMGMFAVPVVGGAAGALGADKEQSAILGDVAGGAIAGSAFGPIGTAVGAIGGGIVGAVSSNDSGLNGAILGQVNKKLAQGLSLAGTGTTALGRAQAGIAAYQTALRQLASFHGKVFDAQRQAIQTEIEARQSVVKSLKEENRQRAQAESMGRSKAAGSDLSRLYHLIRGTGASRHEALTRVNTALFQRAEGLRGPGRAALLRAALGEEQAMAHAHPGAGLHSNVAAVQAEMARLGIAGAVGPRGHVATGSREEWRGIQGQFGFSQRFLQQHSKAPTQLQKLAALSLIAQGYSRDEANAIIMALDGTIKIPRGRKWDGGGSMAGGRSHASGGRLGGIGRGDTVPVPGGMAAPGELVVNRHTERRVNAMLGQHGRSLGGMVGSENHPHRHATGGRTGGPASLAQELWPDYALARSEGFTDAGTYNPASVLPGSGAPSDHSVFPSYAFDSGFSPATGWGNFQAQHFFKQMQGRPEVNYVILGNKIWSRSRGLHAYTAGGHEGHVHVSGIRADGGGLPGSNASTAGGAAGAGGGGRRMRVSSWLGNDSFHGFGKNPGIPGLSTMPDTGGGVPGLGTMPGTGGGAVAVIMRNARALGLDPAAVMAYALTQGGLGWGAIGDHGTSFGPFQAHIGGAAGNRSPADAAAWANSPGGLISMMGMMARAGAAGLSGPDAAAFIVGPAFGRGANPARDIANARARYPQASGIASSWRGALGGRSPRWGGWHGEGGSFLATSPTMIGVGENGAEHVSVTKAGGAGGLPAITVHVNHPHTGEDVREMARRGAAEALQEFARTLERGQ